VLALIRESVPPEAWLAEVRELLAKLKLPKEIEAAVLDDIQRELRHHRLRQQLFRPPPGWTAPRQPKPPPTLFELITQVAIGLDTFLAEERLDELLDALKQLNDRLPEFLLSRDTNRYEVRGHDLLRGELE
jgi:hypothetical protein